MSIDAASLSSVDLDFHNQNTTYMTHGLHPYGAKFPPQLARWAITTFSSPSDLILDCFSGSGTAAVEARLLDRSIACGDVDPLAERVTLAKSTPLDNQQLSKAVNDLRQRLQSTLPLILTKYGSLRVDDAPPAVAQVNGYRVRLPDFPRRDYWFHPRVSIELSVVSQLIGEIHPTEIRRFFEVALSSCIISKTTNTVAHVADLVHTRPHYLQKPNPPSVIEIFLRKLERAQEAMTEFSSQVNLLRNTSWVGEDIRSGLRVEDCSVQLIITSPPYINALDYPRANKFTLPWLGISYEKYQTISLDHIGLQRAPMQRWQTMASEGIGIDLLDRVVQEVSERSLKSASLVKRYLLDMRDAFKEMHRVLNRGRYAAVVIGESTVDGYRVNSPDLLLRLACSVGFTHVHTISRRLDSGKRYLPFRDSGIDGGIREEAVLILHKS